MNNKISLLTLGLVLLLLFSVVSVSAFNLDDLKSLFSFNGGKVQLAPPPACATAAAPMCNGPCPPGQTCTSNAATGCICLPSDNVCGGSFPMCNGQCPAGQTCQIGGVSAAGTPSCICNPPPTNNPPTSPPPTTTCGSQHYPQCFAGPCPSGQTCQVQGGSCACLSDAPSSSPSIPSYDPSDPDFFTSLPIQPDCANLPYGYDLLTVKVRKDYVTKKISASSSGPIRYLTITSCNPEAFGSRKPDVLFPSEKVSTIDRIDIKDGSTAYIITGIKDEKALKYFKNSWEWGWTNIFYLSNKDALEPTIEDGYFYWSSLYKNVFTKYAYIGYDLNEGWWSILWGTPTPSARIWLWGDSPILEDEDNHKNYDTKVVISDVPKKFMHFSDELKAKRYGLTDAEVNILKDYVKIFDAYSEGAYISALDENLLRIVINYDPEKNEFVLPKDGYLQVGTVKTNSILDMEYNSYPVPFILKSGTNVFKVSKDEIRILYSQKHQNRAAVTFGTVYGSKPATSSSCVSACFQQASQIPSKCAPISDCKLNCPIDPTVGKQAKACIKKFSLQSICENKAIRDYGKKPSLASSEEEYVAKKCGSSDPCVMPTFVPRADCASRCGVEETLCNSHETLSKKMTCEVKCVSNSNPQCSAAAFQVKLKAKKWSRVAIPAKAPAVVSVKEFIDCEGLQIRTIKGKKVGVVAEYLSNTEIYAFKAPKACTAKYVPFACRPAKTIDNNAPVTDEPLEDPDSEDSE
jgi:hypothetical protein